MVALARWRVRGEPHNVRGLSNGASLRGRRLRNEAANSLKAGRHFVSIHAAMNATWDPMSGLSLRP
jgi:hypothetical protein